MIHCPHLRASTNVEIMDFTARWVTMPLLVEASMPPPAEAILMRQPPRARSVTAVTFLQICGVTEDSDPNWSVNGPLYRGAGVANTSQTGVT